MKRKFQISVSLFIVLLLGCLIFFSIKPRKFSEEPIKPRSYNRIISLAPNITEILFVLELGDKIIGVSEFCNYPPQAKLLPRVGALLNPNFEAIIAAEPDLVILLDEMADDKDKFTSLGIETLVVKHDSLNEILDSIRTIGLRCGKAPQAEGIIGGIENKIKMIQAAVQNETRPKVLISLGRDYSQEPSAKPQHISIAGNDGFYSQMIEYAGGQNAYDGKMPFPVISWESVVSMNPQIIIDIAPVETKPTDSQVMTQQWKNFNQVDAAVNDAIYIFTEDYTAIPGPRFILTLEKIARIINPQLKIQDDEPNSN